jgi:hypothetical protein
MEKEKIFTWVEMPTYVEGLGWFYYDELVEMYV